MPVMVSALLPVFAIETGSDDCIPVDTLPNARVAGVTDSTAGGGAVPVPASETVALPTELAMVSASVEAVSALGAKVTVAGRGLPAGPVPATAGRAATL